MKWQAASGKRQAETRPRLRRASSIMAVALALAAGSAMSARAQDQPAPKDDALDSLLEKVSGATPGGEKPADKSSARKEEPNKKKTDEAPAARPTAPDARKEKDQAGQGAKDGKKPAKKPEELSGKD